MSTLIHAQGGAGVNIPLLAGELITLYSTDAATLFEVQRNQVFKIGYLFNEQKTFGPYASDKVVRIHARTADVIYDIAADATADVPVYDNSQITGEWEPEIADAETGGNEASSFINSQSSFIEIGKFITVFFDFQNINTSGMTAGNDLYIRGLPKAASAGFGASLVGVVRVDRITFSGFVNAGIPSSKSHFRLISHITGANAVVIKVSDLTSGTARIAGNISYISA